MLETRSRVPIRAIYSCFHANSLRLELDVLCPSGARAQTLDACAQCPVARAVRLGSLGHASFVTCEPRPTTIPSSLEDAVPNAGAALPSTELRVMPHVQVADVARCIDVLGVAAAVVVDTSHRALGVIGPATLLRACANATSSHVEAGQRAASAIMEPVTLTLPAQTPLPQAAAAMAYEQADAACVVGTGGELIGLLTPIDLLRALSSTSGYLLGGAEALMMRRPTRKASDADVRLH